jgi:CRISPR-associated protein Csm1
MPYVSYKQIHIGYLQPTERIFSDMKYNASLAALIHDIGKFWQRAEASPIQTLAPNYEKFSKDDYGHNGAHATWSSAFVERYMPKDFAQEVNSAVLFHHKPNDDLSRLVTLADHLASGERLASNDKHPQLLKSVMTRIGNTLEESNYLPLQPLGLEEDILFPLEDVPDKNKIRQDYQTLWQEFVEEVQLLKHIKEMPAYIEALGAILKQYTWCIPSAYYGSEPDISLYDHSRVASAIAACISGLDSEMVSQILANKGKSKTPVATLIEGDISGVQRFIYTVTSSGAAKQLRARSFYLQVLTESVARYILNELDLPSTCQIYVGGGHFYLLAPPNSEAKITQIRQHLEEVILSHHDGELYLALGAATLTATDFTDSNLFSTKWHEVGQATGEAKRRRFSHLSAEQQLKYVFDPRQHDGELHKRYQERDEDTEDNIVISGLSESLEKLGTGLTHSQHLLMFTMEKQQRSEGTIHDTLAELGIGIAFKADEIPNVDIKLITVLKLTDGVDVDIVPLQNRFGCDVVQDLRYTVNSVPQKGRYGVATFDEMRQAAHGIKRFGVLRMDVDDLGQLFARGFVRDDGKSDATLARVASLSFSLGLFFEGWVGKLCEDINKEKRMTKDTDSDQEVEIGTVYSVYSGGDDLFIVGTWDVLPDLAESIQNDLSRYAGNNPAVHISGGITLHSGKYPLYLAAEDAERALDEAKDMQGKNGISFLGTVTKWNRWEDVTNMRDQLVMLSKGTSRGLLQTLIELHTEYIEARKIQLSSIPANFTQTGQTQMVWGAWLWHSAYRLRRLADRAGSRYRDDVNKLYDQLIDSQFQGIELAGLAARWADALTRKTTHKEE